MVEKEKGGAPTVMFAGCPSQARQMIDHRRPEGKGEESPFSPNISSPKKDPKLSVSSTPPGDHPAHHSTQAVGVFLQPMFEGEWPFFFRERVACGHCLRAFSGRENEQPVRE